MAVAADRLVVLVVVIVRHLSAGRFIVQCESGHTFTIDTAAGTITMTLRTGTPGGFEFLSAEPVTVGSEIWALYLDPARVPGGSWSVRSVVVAITEVRYFMGEDTFSAYILYHQLLDASRIVMGWHIHTTYKGAISVEEGVASARGVLLEREACDVRDFDRQRELTEKYRRVYKELSGCE